MKPMSWQRGCCLLLCLLLLPVYAWAETAWKIELSAQQHALAAGTSGEINFEMQLDGFRDYGMEISVEWCGSDGEKVVAAPRGIRFAGATGAPTDKTLRFAVDTQAAAGTYLFQVIVDGRRSEMSHLTLDVAEAMQESNTVEQRSETQAIFAGGEVQDVSALLEAVNSDAYLQEVCQHVQADVQDAALYQLHFYDAHGQELQTLEEKLYVYLPVEDAEHAVVYTVEAENERRIGARASEEGLRIAVKDAGEYLVVCP